MYMVLIERVPSQCMDDIEIKYFDSEEDANTYVKDICGQATTDYCTPTNFTVYQQLTKVKGDSEIFDCT